MKFINHLIYIAGFILLVISSSALSEDTATVSLISEFNGITNDKKVSLAVTLTPNPGWHVYWKYAGDYGSAPKFNFKFNNKDITPKLSWPTPEIIRGKTFVNYGYSKKALYLAEFLAENVKKNNIVELDFEWLACKVECIPGFKKLKIELPKTDRKVNSKFKKLIEDTRFTLPIPLSNYKVEYQINSNNKLELFFPDLPDNTKKLNFIPETKRVIKNKAKQLFNPITKTLTLETRGKLRDNFYLKGLLIKYPEFETKRTALNIEIGTKPKNISTKVKENMRSNLIFILFASLLGGIILNFMPCVFPVIGIKILSLTKKAGKDLGYRLKHSSSFAFGILITFWFFSLAIKIAKSFGNEIGWGFQLQNPEFVIFLIFLLTLVALNLLGLFDLRIIVNQSENNKDRKDNLYNSFLSGILTTVLATPCTAPFMASALAYGLSANYLESFLVFTFLALGLALPYTLLACVPGAIRILPKPGEWMNKLKIFLAFPIFATIIWLLWVLEKQSSSDFLFFILFITLAVSLATWIFGNYNNPSKSKKVRWLSLVLFIVFLVSSYIYSINTVEHKIKYVESVDKLGAFTTDNYGQKWYAYSDKLLEDLEARKQSYYLDVTAAWCLTCQLNKANVFGSKEVRKSFFDKSIKLIKADWTYYDANITQLLESNGKAGIPLNIFYDGSKNSKETLPQLLSASLILKLIN